MRSQIVHLNHSIDQYIKKSPINSKYNLDLPDNDLSDSISQSSSTTLANYQANTMSPHKYQFPNTNHQPKIMNSQKFQSPVKSQINYPNNYSTPTQRDHEISDYSTPIQQIIPPIETMHYQPTHRPIIDKNVSVRKRSFYNTTSTMESGNVSKTENNHANSTDSFNSCHNSSASLKRYDTTNSLISTMSSKKYQIKNKLKRLSGSFSRSDVPLTSNKRFSLSNGLKRMSLGYNMNMANSNNLNKNYHQNENDSNYTSYPQTNLQSSRLSLDTSKESALPYWKYHILKYGKDLYLTTNPGIRHMYCRNGPGYYVEIIYNDKSSKPKISNGFILVFKDINNIDQSKDCIANNNTKIPVLMTITKKSKVEGGHYTVSIPKANNNTPPNQFNSPMFNGLSIPKEINQNYIPATNESIEFVNYEFRDFNNTKWNIGSIPRIKMNKAKYLKNKLNNHQNYSAPTLNNNRSNTNISLNSTNYRPDLQSINNQNISASSLNHQAAHINDNSSSASIHNYNTSSVSLNRLDSQNPSSTSLTSNVQNPSYQEQYTFIGKKNVFFHQNYIDIESDQQAHNITYKDKTNDLENIYLDRNNDFPPVLAMFRPYEIKMRKRLMQSFNKNKKQLINHIEPSIPANNMDYKFNSKNLKNDLGAGSNVKTYYTGGDGLYYVTNPSDDSPDDNKLGWITIYEDHRIFGKHNKGMYEIVLGLTLAVGLERSSEH